VETHVNGHSENARHWAMYASTRRKMKQTQTQREPGHESVPSLHPGACH
jgi:hypothetical protein